MADTSEVQHNAAQRRFTLETQAGTAFLSYEPVADGVLDLQHTVVPEPVRGGGVGDALVRGVFAHVRRAGLRVIPTCPFVEAWLERHPDERALVVVPPE